ncbi:MAG TPA: ATP-binding protein [Burkholderiales bacterium]|nr:ATP-binding protein [Burkholderiales bacterium]
MRLTTGLLPASLFGQVTLILVVGLVAAQLGSIWLHRGAGEAASMHEYFARVADRVAAEVDALDRLPTGERAAYARAASDAELAVETGVANAPAEAGWVPPPFARALGEGLGGRYEFRADAPGGRGPPLRGLTVDVRLKDGTWARFRAAPMRIPREPSSLLFYLGLMVSVVAAVVLLAVRSVTRPLRVLGDAARSLGEDLARPPLPEVGPREAREAARAFNEMQARLRDMVDQRTRALSAMSHDLRTPITRLRLRSEMLEDQALRGKLQADLDDMQRLVDVTLDYLRGLKEAEPIHRVDVDGLAAGLADDFASMGRPIEVSGRAERPFEGRPLALRRALTNLLENALTYGGKATLRIEDSPASLRLIVEDEGPGIPESDLARVVEPFERLEASRSRGTGGVGLGLSIARDIAASHGGALRLENRAPRGLRAILELPRRGQR